jgi:hypothetical protein
MFNIQPFWEKRRRHKVIYPANKNNNVPTPVQALVLCITKAIIRPAKIIANISKIIAQLG